jgi:hypothetical protein
VVHGADADQCAGHGGVGGGECHRQVGHGQACLGGEGDELFYRVEPVLVAEVLDQSGPPQVVALVLADAASEQSLAERARSDLTWSKPWWKAGSTPSPTRARH